MAPPYDEGSALRWHQVPSDSAEAFEPAKRRAANTPNRLTGAVSGRAGNIEPQPIEGGALTGGCKRGMQHMRDQADPTRVPLNTSRAAARLVAAAEEHLRAHPSRPIYADELSSVLG